MKKTHVAIHQLMKPMLFIMGILLAQHAYAQDNGKHLIDHKPLMNEVWETFDKLLYKVEVKDGKTIYTPFFPPSLLALNGKKVKLRGYIVPINSGVYFGEVDHVIPWQIDHLICWRS